MPAAFERRGLVRGDGPAVRKFCDKRGRFSVLKWHKNGSVFATPAPDDRKSDDHHDKAGCRDPPELTGCQVRVHQWNI